LKQTNSQKHHKAGMFVCFSAQSNDGWRARRQNERWAMGAYFIIFQEATVVFSCAARFNKSSRLLCASRSSPPDALSGSRLPTPLRIRRTPLK
jgi:choline dehydrogenase-like flavoprotein